MGVEDTSSGQVFEKLVEMGFESSAAADAIKEVGASLNCAIEFLLKDTQGNNIEASSSSNYSSRSGRALGKKEFALSHPSRKLRQCSILEALPPTKGTKKSRTNFGHEVSNSGSEVLPSALQEPKDHGPFQVPKEPLFVSGCNLGIASDSSIMAVHFPEGLQTGVDWEQMANQLLQKHFGYSSLKGFQKEALAAWLAHEDCLVLAATGSGKSLCFQIPALLSGKVVVVISPLISLMHDQCLKLARHGVSACFLGSGQPDSGVEHRAMSGKYGLIYLCPETLVRLIKPLQWLAESRGIALFAIDEVHCVSKWGHDFRTEYRRLSVLRENFSVGNLNFLKYDIPIMALTATATTFVQEDILMSLKMSKKTKMVLTSFFRPNLRFAVKHSRTSSRSSYEKDFAELIDVYARGRKTDGKRCSITWQDRKEVSGDSSSIANDSRLELDEVSMGGGGRIEDSYFDRYNNANSSQEKCSRNSKRKQLTVEYLEDEVDNFQSVDDWDVACGEFCGKSPAENKNVCGSPSTLNPPVTLEDEAAFPQGLLEDGPTIIYVPTRKETQSIADYLCRIGVKAAAYNAKLAKSHLRRVHKEFHENSLEVVVATIAFGMGIDKSNVRRIIHYGWPQSLEAYYQEAGRAGRDGRLADCVLYANLLRVPTLLPCRRSEEQNKQAYKMLADCYRYGMKTSYCRARLLVEYFGEDFKHEKCLLCDVCVSGHQKVENLKEEADILLEAIASTNEQSSYVELDGFHGEIVHSGQQRSSREKLNMRAFASRIREQFHKFATIDHRWWQGLARILEDKGYIKEGDDKPHVQIKFPELTEMGRSFLQSKREQTFLAHPEADMVLLMEESRGPFSSFAEWGKGWADPEIRRRRLGAKQRTGRRQRRRRPRKNRPPTKTGRERLKAKLAKCK